VSTLKRDLLSTVEGFDELVVRDSWVREFLQFHEGGDQADIGGVRVSADRIDLLLDHAVHLMLEKVETLVVEKQSLVAEARLYPLFERVDDVMLHRRREEDDS